MKKTFLIILSSFLAAAAFNVALTPVAPAFASEKDKIKVYYSEPLGTEAGDKVYHITACKKQLAYAPVTCIKKSDTKAYFNPGGQCVKGGKALGDMVRGCKIMPEEYLDALTQSYEKVNPDLTQCKDDPSKQKVLYAQEWAVVNKNGKDDYKKWEFKGTIVWADNNGETEKPTSDNLKVVFDEKPSISLEAVPLYRTGLCVEYDIFDDLEKKSEEQLEIVNNAKELAGQYGIPDVIATGNKLTYANPSCNNSNADKEINSVPASTPFNEQDSYSCTTAYRISGSSGSEIFGKYISAIYIWVASIGGIIAVLIMVFSGIQISMAGADSGALDSAKNRIVQSLVGLVILFLAGLILYTINPSFFTG